MSALVALVDGSIYSQSVCDHAAWIARRTGSAVEILHVLGRRQTASAPNDLSGNIALGARSTLLEELSSLDAQMAKLAQKRGRAILEDARERLLSAGVDQVTTKLRIGDLVETVSGAGSGNGAGADMVVIGKRGEAADFATGHLGSNLERIARSCRQPVFVASRAWKPIERLLIAFDGGTSSVKAVEHVAGNPLFAGLHCKLLTVGGDDPLSRERLRHAELTLETAGYRVDCATLPGQPEQVISQAVETDGIDLLVMGAYGHSRIRAMIIGSTTAEMVRLCRIPVILFR